MEDLSKLISPFFEEVCPRGAPPTFSISIPKDHPRAEEIVALARKLATRFTTPGGLVVDRPVFDPEDRQRVFIEVLQEFCEVEGFDLKASLQEMLRVSNAAPEKRPKNMGGLVSLLLSGAVHSGLRSLPRSKRTELANVADELVHRGM